MRALSIQQPWAWLIVNGWKDIENRDWYASHRGPVLIHAGKKADAEALHELRDGYHPVTARELPPDLHAEFLAVADRLPMGGIVGRATVAGCVERSLSPWFVGRYGFVMVDAAPLPLIPLRGQLGFFDVPPEVADRAADARTP